MVCEYEKAEVLKEDGEYSDRTGSNDNDGSKVNDCYNDNDNDNTLHAITDVEGLEQPTLARPPVAVDDGSKSASFGGQDDDDPPPPQENERKNESGIGNQDEDESAQMKQKTVDDNDEDDLQQPQLQLHPQLETRKQRSGARNQHKMKFFVRWLLQTFPSLHIPLQTADDDHYNVNVNSESLSSPSLASSSRSVPWILDVAGGKGELAVRLALCHGLRVTVIDPRPTELVNPVAVWHQQILPRLPNKWQQRYHDQSRHRPDLASELLQQRFSHLSVPLTYRTLQSSVELQQAIQQCDLLIGMHADSATEVIVDAALQYQKPFVVVPCCVFPNLFPHRRIRPQAANMPSDETSTARTRTTATALKAGQHAHNNTSTNNRNVRIRVRNPPEQNGFVQVRNHDQFCQYLLERDPRFRRAILPFTGRNIGIWWDGQLE